MQNINNDDNQLVTLQLTDDNKSPDQVLSTTDPGDDVQRRFFYQHSFTSMIALQMYKGNIPYREILCEQHEDLLCVREDGYFEGIQVKTQLPQRGLVELNTPAVFKSFCRFIDLESEFSGKFSKFILAYNCEFLTDKSSKSLINFLDQIHKATDLTNIQFNPKRDYASFVSSLSKQCSVSEVDVLTVLKKTKTQVCPSFDEIEPKTLTEHLSSIESCKELPVEILRNKLAKLRGKIYYASSKSILEPIKDYVALLDSKGTVEQSEINAKRITKQMVEKIVEHENLKRPLLSNRNDFPTVPSPEWSTKLRTKMNFGFIDQDDIDQMDNLRFNAEEHFFKKHYRSDNNIRKEFDHLQAVVLTQALEAKSRAKRSGTPYGTVMLHQIEDRLDHIATHRKEDVLGYQYEILKGIVGILTGECRLAFSDVPTGGWKFE